ncbi:hypothetical protein BaRGS_00009955 [Batillaria attramentaria]|uniref:Secreted protein n=1 Tax=Batillaria attramentaria TaxID=370345 RepID=A0ABD0LHH0_9CAEN
MPVACIFLSRYDYDKCKSDTGAPTAASRSAASSVEQVIIFVLVLTHYGLHADGGSHYKHTHGAYTVTSPHFSLSASLSYVSVRETEAERQCASFPCSFRHRHNVNYTPHTAGRAARHSLTHTTCHNPPLFAGTENQPIPTPGKTSDD